MGPHIHSRASVKNMTREEQLQRRAFLERGRQAAKAVLKETIKRAQRDAAAAVRVQVAAEKAAAEARTVAAAAQDRVQQLLTPNTRAKHASMQEKLVEQQAAEDVELIKEEIEEHESLEDETGTDQVQEAYTYQPSETELDSYEQVQPPTDPVRSTLRVAAGDSINDSLAERLKRMYNAEQEPDE